MLFLQVDVANSLSPPAVPGKTLAAGNPGAGRTAPYMLNYDTSKEKRIFGLKYKTMEEISRDMLVDFNRRGWSVSKTKCFCIVLNIIPGKFAYGLQARH